MFNISRTKKANNLYFVYNLCHLSNIWYQRRYSSCLLNPIFIGTPCIIEKTLKLLYTDPTPLNDRNELINKCRQKMSSFISKLNQRGGGYWYYFTSEFKFWNFFFRQNIFNNCFCLRHRVWVRGKQLPCSFRLGEYLNASLL